MELTGEQIRIITKYPVDILLARVASELSHLNETSWRGRVGNFFCLLANSDAAFNLPTNGEGIYLRLYKVGLMTKTHGFFSLSDFSSLIDAVVANSSEAVIWTAVINIIETLDPLPPLSADQVPTGAALPLESTVGYIDLDHTVRAHIEQNRQGAIHLKVPGFFRKHFIPAGQHQECMIKALLKHHDGKRWTRFPLQASRELVWDWLVGLEKAAMPSAPYKLHSTKRLRLPSIGADFSFSNDRRGKMGLLFRKPHPKKDYRSVLVVGHHEMSHRPDDVRDFQRLLLQLSKHVQSVFRDQPLRRFVHAFTIYDTMMELWVYDRSGLYSSGAFDIHKHPMKLAHALVAYASMDDDAIGLATFFKHEGDHLYIALKSCDASGEDKRIAITKNGLLAFRGAIVSRGTTCYKTEEGVVKFSWRSVNQRPSEVETLTLAATRGVDCGGIAKILAHRDITSIAELRRGLEFSAKTRYNTLSDPGIDSSSDGGLFDALHSRGSGSMGGDGDDKDNEDDDDDEDDEDDKDDKTDKDGKDDGRSKKRRRYTWLSNVLQRGNKADDAANEKAQLGLEGQAKVGSDKALCLKLNNDSHDALPANLKTAQRFYENRILSCILISPVGRVITYFTSIRELLEALRDAIRAHQILFTHGRILHRDISPSNIIITGATDDTAFKGALIDLDMARDLDAPPNDGGRGVGTTRFMAIGVHEGEENSYRHDLESFFYVLVYLCGHCSWYRRMLLRDGETQKPKRELHY